MVSRASRFVLVAHAALLFVAAGAWALQGGAQGWESASRGPVTVLFREADRAAAGRLLELAAPSLERMWTELDSRERGAVRIVIAASEEEFAGLEGGWPPDWGVAWADAGRSLVVMKSPRIVSYPLQIEKVVVHELAHVVVGRELQHMSVPRWFDEGIAMALAGEWDGDRRALAAAAVAGRLIPLSSLDAGFPESDRDARLAYAMSYEAVQYLLRESGLAGGPQLVRAVASAPDFETALLRVAGRAPGQFDVEVGGHVRRTFGWTVLLQSVSAAMLLGAVALVLGAVRRARRARARLRELAAEEAERAPRGRSRTGSSWA
ncbi:MAG: hypothetical protein FJY74_01080 [Candidatus Eisenbacteria bacterium]|nr:hypothetical protein [Candidatus Eisenbacteria bacterium]